MAKRTFTRKDFQRWGAKGGHKRATNLTPEALSAIGRKGAQARADAAKAAQRPE